MSVTKKDVEHIARLALLELDDREKELYQKQLSAILDWMDQLKELDAARAAPAAGHGGALRPDTPVRFPGAQDLLANAPAREYDLIKVKKVLE